MSARDVGAARRSPSLQRISPRAQHVALNMSRHRNKAADIDQSVFLKWACTEDDDRNTPLYKACADNQYREAETICKRLVDMPGGDEELKRMLVLKNHEGLTPVDAAIAAAGDSDSGDASLKLLLGAYIKQLDMLVELFAKEDEGKGIWTRQGFKLPQLGALLVASKDEELTQERSGVKLLEGADQYKEFLNEYAELPHEGIGLIVANAFMAEYAERKLWDDEISKPWKTAGGTYGRSSRLGRVLNRCVMLAQDAKQAEGRCESQYRSTEAAKFRELAERLQAATATALDSLGNDVAYAVACSIEGDQALNLAVQTDQTVLLASHCLVGVILRKWRGPRLHGLLDRSNTDPYSPISSIGMNLYFALLIVLNVLLLPFAAVTPALAKYRDYGYGRMFQEGYLLQTAFFQAGAFAVPCTMHVPCIHHAYTMDVPGGRLRRERLLPHPRANRALHLCP
jgi:hypothetical protein